MTWDVLSGKGTLWRHKLVPSRLILRASSQAGRNHVFFPDLSMRCRLSTDRLSRSDLADFLPLWAFGCPLLSLFCALYLNFISVLSRSSL